MDFRFTEEEEQLRREVVDFLRKEVTPDIVAEVRECYRSYDMWAPLTSNIIRKIGAKGWLVPHWPKEYGGLGSSHMATFMTHDEMAYFGLPDIFMGALWCGPIIMREGSDELKEEFLLPLAKGEIEFALGYSEPEAGCDLAAIQLRAEDKGDYFLLNGQKIFSSSARFAKYHFLAARTDWEIPQKHRGISLMIVDLKSPGITIEPMPTMSGWAGNRVFYNNVRVSKKYLLGELNRGFYYLMAALDRERMFMPGMWRRLFENLVDYTKEAKRNGRPLRQDPLVRQKLAQIATELEVSRLLYYRIAYLVEKGEAQAYHSSLEKWFWSEMIQHLTNTGMQIMGLYGQLRKGSKWAPLSGDIELYYRRTVGDTIAAGTNEIQRSIIALRGLGLPTS